MDLFWVSLASLVAGFVDAIVGGGGLVIVPAMFAVFPNAHPATLFGTGKSAGVWGTGAAAFQYARRVEMRWAVLVPAVVAAAAGAFTGAWAVTLTDPAFLRKLLPFVLTAVLVYTLARKDLGRHHRPGAELGRERLAACVIGALLGFYDGFFGPGTGSFFVFAFVRVMGYDFLHASAAAKLLNVATNLAAVGLFAWKGHVWWQLGLVMAVANVAGSLVGTRLALKHGAGFVRAVFVALVALLIARTAYDAFFK